MLRKKARAASKKNKRKNGNLVGGKEQLVAAC